MADARIANGALELDPLCLELASGLRDVGHSKGDVRGVRDEIAAERCRIYEIERHVAGLDLRPRFIPVRTVHAERVAVEGLGALHVLDRHRVEVGSLDLHDERDYLLPRRPERI